MMGGRGGIPAHHSGMAHQQSSRQQPQPIPGTVAMEHLQVQIYTCCISTISFMVKRERVMFM